jgi:LysR family transcriptional regulator, regulator of abg operon
MVIMVGMKLNGLQALVAALEEGSLRGAARRLGLSQPAMTKALRELEREVGAPLLQRAHTGVTATAQGQVLFEHARSVQRELESARQTIAQLGGQMAGELKVGAVPLALLLLIPETARTFGRAFPDIRLHVREELYVAQLTNLRGGEMDVVLGPIPEGLPHGEFHIEPLLPIEMAVVVGKGSPLAQCQTLAELCHVRWVFTSATGSTSYAKLLFQQHGLEPPQPAAVANSTLGLMALITGGECAGLMPMPIASHPAAQHFLEVVPIREGHLRLQLGAMCRPDALLKPMVRHFLSHLHRAANQARLRA